jgi:predicted dithiol-disulfide oxidoreductase (DUF899 family)
MGWSFPLASNQRDYNFDMDTRTQRKLSKGGWRRSPRIVARNAGLCGTEPARLRLREAAMSTYALEDEKVYLTYSTTARGLEFMMVYCAFLDQTRRIARRQTSRRPGCSHDKYPTRR